MIRRLGWFVMLLILVGCSTAGRGALMQSGMNPEEEGQNLRNEGGAQLTAQVVLPDYGPAPELGNDVWLNTDQPLRLADMRGKVVLIDMWTYG